MLKLSKRALITGITGQDGSYLAELLLGKGYEVHGLIRRASTFNTSRIDHLYVDPHDPEAKLFLHYGDLTDGARLVTLLARDRPGRGLQPRRPVPRPGQLRRARAHRRHHRHRARSACSRPCGCRASNCRFYQASSSEMFGATPPPQNEETPFYPRSPYGAAKVYAYWMTRNYREALRHVRGQRHPVQPRVAAPRRDLRDPQDHPRGRPDQGRARQDYVYMGNLDAVRDWGYAPSTSRHVADAAGRRARRLRARHRRQLHASGTSSVTPSSTPAWTGRSTCGSTSATCARPRSTR